MLLPGGKEPFALFEATHEAIYEAGDAGMTVGSRISGITRHIKRDRQLLIIFIPCITFYLIFRYWPMYGVMAAFKKYNVYLGIGKSPWVGLKYFMQFFTSADFPLLLKNTFLLGAYSLFWTFPLPVLFAVLLNEIRGRIFRQTVQTLSYLPSFLSVVVVCGMTIEFLSPAHGLVNNILGALGFERQYFIANPRWFRTIYISTEIWSGLGLEAIIYMASLTKIEKSLYEAGIIDGCGRLQAIRYITLPGIFPVIAAMFILKTGSVFRIGFEKVLLLYTPTTYEVADVFSTYVYRKGMLDMNYSYGAAVGLFESAVALAMLLIANAVSRKFSGHGLW